MSWKTPLFVHKTACSAYSITWLCSGYPREMARRFGHAGDVTTNITKPDDHPATVFVFKYTHLHICYSLQFSTSNVLQAMGTAPSTSKRVVDEETGLWWWKWGVWWIWFAFQGRQAPWIKQLEVILSQRELRHLHTQLVSSEDRKPSCVKMEYAGSQRQPIFTHDVLYLTEDQLLSARAWVQATALR